MAMSLLHKISAGLGKTREKMAKTFQAVFGSSRGQDQMELLEEFLLLADVGPSAAHKIVRAVENRKEDDLVASLRVELLNILDAGPVTHQPVLILVGINGTGKTTSAGKLCHYLQKQGRKVFVIGADTFRAAADMQLEEWCRRTQTPFLIGKFGSDPGSVVYDGLNSAAAKNSDTVIIDTAGRLHVNKNLMQELEKIIRVANKVRPDSVEVLLTLDAAMGQNALEQMEVFHKWVNPAGIIITKLDGSAKGGTAVALVEKYRVPIKYVGVGESLDDLVPFDARIYVNSLLPSPPEQ